MDNTHVTQELADEYAIGSLDERTQGVVLLHVAACRVCREMIVEAEHYAASLALSLGRRHPPERLKRRVFAEAGIGRRSRALRALRTGRAFAGVAAVLLAAASLAGMVAVRQDVGQLRAENADLQRSVNEASSQRVQIAALTDRLARAEELSSRLELDGQADRDLLLAQMSPSANVADVVGVNDFTSAIGRLVWDEEQKRVWFVAAQLPRRPLGENYELWVSANGRWISLGTFNPDETGFARLESVVPNGLRGYEAAVVTIELAGSAERRGPSVFVTDLAPFRR